MKALLLNSGGLDSRLTGFFLKKTGWEIVSLYVDIGHLNTKRAKKAAKETARILDAEHHEVKINWPFPVNLKNDKSFNWIPYVQGITTGIGGAIARKLGIEYLAIGHKDGEQSTHQVQALQGILSSSSIAQANSNLTILHPISACVGYRGAIDFVKEKVGKLPDLDNTVSCGWEKPCQKCVKCKERKEVGIKYG